MLQNYFKIALRNLRRNKIYVLINVLGLGLALASGIIAYLNWKFNDDFDNQHRQKDQLFRVEVFKSSNDQLYGVSPLPLGDAALNDISGIQESIRLNIGHGVIKSGDDVYNERLYYADKNFLEVFDFEILNGDAKSLLDKSKVLITEEMAVKYFGDEDPIGESLIINPGKEDEKSLAVGAVLKNIPLNSSIRFNFLTNFGNQYYQGRPLDQTDWRHFTHVHFLKLQNPSEAPQIAKNLNRYVSIQNKAREDWQIKSFFLEPITTIAANSHSVRWNYLTRNYPSAAVWGPIVMAIMLLLTSCLNFTNTTISLSNQRLKEMGVRKVMGGTQKQLIAQLLSESFVICMMALVAGIAFVEFFLPPYNEMWPYLHLEANYFENLPLVMFMGATLLITVILGGAYPAFYISSFNPTNIFRGSVKFSGNNLFSRILLGIQIAISLSAVIVGVAFAQNASFQETADLGYDNDDILIVPTYEKGTFEGFRNVVDNNPKVIASSGTRHHFEADVAITNYEIQGEEHECRFYGIGQNYFEVMDMELVEGRFLDHNRKLDYENALLINETFAKRHQLDKPVGQKITIDSVEHTIVGVAKDFLYEGFFNPIEPTVLKLVKPDRFIFCVIEAKPDDLIALNNELKTKWTSLFPFTPYEGFFQLEQMGMDVRVNKNITIITLFLAVVTILLSSAGLFALVSLNIMKRLKEIAIRKVVGASTGHIAYLINKNYIWIFLIAAVIGSVGGAFEAELVMGSIFATHADVGIGVLIIGCLAVFLIAALTVGHKIYKVTKTNPSDILKAD